ncbi:hypothetical protein CXB51_019234 [Gossypium anomalum]|uniref:Reverse transcriptase Ty1/copia-type domain-containing protein n=1 Tax=Gossypium anomalum TaxID=47600 RepID=A0A8J5YNG7_9ROSI|nr:hypothetical protein CXB51_019234 [Gossypium anomalum]
MTAAALGSVARAWLVDLVVEHDRNSTSVAKLVILLNGVTIDMMMIQMRMAGSHASPVHFDCPSSSRSLLDCVYPCSQPRLFECGYTNYFSTASSGCSMHKLTATTTLSVVVDSTWYIDSGAMTHMTNDSAQFVDSYPYPGSGKFVIGNGYSIPIWCVRNSMLFTGSDPLLLKDLLNVPAHTDVELSSQPSVGVTVFEQWHQRLGHPALSVVKQVLRSCNVDVNQNKTRLYLYHFGQTLSIRLFASSIDCQQEYWMMSLRWRNFLVRARITSIFECLVVSVILCCGHIIVTGSNFGRYRVANLSSSTSATELPMVDTQDCFKKCILPVYDELHALIKNNTWELVLASSVGLLVCCKWLFKVKKNPDDSIARLKVQLVAQGFSQTPRLDYHETFCPVVKVNTVCMILALVVSHKWKLHQVDINNVFLNGELVENVYMKQAPSFEFALKDLEELNYFLGLEVVQYGDFIHASQQKYVQDLFEHAHMEDAKQVNTLMVSFPTLTYLVSSLLPNVTLYRKIVGSLQYLRLTGPDIAFASSKKQSFVSRSTSEAEYRSLADATSELTWYRMLLDELSVKVRGILVIWCDNSSAMSLATNPVLRARVKHVEMDMHFVRDKVLSGQLQVNHIPGCDQVVDVLTKPLTIVIFTRYRECMNVFSASDFLKGSKGGILDKQLHN